MKKISNSLSNKYLVIGAGSAGLTVAIGLAKAGKEVTLVAKELGGDCTNYGCIPSKSLIESAKQGFSINHAYRVISNNIKKVRSHEQMSLEHNDINYIEGEFRFTDIKSGEITTRKEIIKIDFKKAVIATGSRPRTLDLGTEYETNETIFSINPNFKSIDIIGGGFIAVELAGAFAEFGKKVVIYARSKLLKDLDEKLQDSIISDLKNNGVEVHENVGDLLEVNEKLIFDSKKFSRNEKLMLAVGRLPNSNLDLAKAGIDLDNKHIKVNKSLNTTNPHVYAIGDVASREKFTHVAGDQGRFIVQKLLTGYGDYKKKIVASITFYTNPIGMVGELKENSIYKIAKLNFNSSDRGIIKEGVGEQPDDIALISYNRFTGSIHGLQSYGTSSESLTSLISFMINNGKGIRHLHKSMIPYPIKLKALDSLYPQYISDIPSSIKNYIQHNKLRLSILILWLIAVITALTYFSTNGTDSIIDMLMEYKGTFSIFLIYFSLYVIRGLFFISSAALSLTSVLLFEPITALIVVIVSSNASALVNFWLSDYISPKNSNYLERFNISGAKSIFWARILSLPYDLVSVAAGLTKISTLKFILASALGSLPGTLLIIFGSEAFLTFLDNIYRQPVKYFFYGLGILAIYKLLNYYTRVALAYYKSQQA